ncbi:MAG TPA: hypothetical protein ENN67_03430 [Firmicutes bacterium]|nr:hypothetical protein [Bacillota bacterium]
MFIFLISPAYAITVRDVVTGVDLARKPESLKSISFMADMRIDISNAVGAIIPQQANYLAAWRSPDEWFCTWELNGELAAGLSGIGASGGHPALDHAELSRPDFIDVLSFSFNFEYQGSAVWDGEPSWQLRLVPIDRTLDIPSFNIIIRKDDFVPMRTVVRFADNSVAITDLKWTRIDGVLVPSKFTTFFNPPSGFINGFQTTFFNHEINPDLTGIDFTRREGTLLTSNDSDVYDEPAVFEELYHGFADDPIIAPIEDSSGTYTKISFTFSLYVEDSGIVTRLDRNRQAVIDLAVGIVSGYKWSGDNGLSKPSGKWKCGRDIMKALNESFETEKITDFYFLELNPE